MQSLPIIELLKQVVTSWQVIAVTIAMVLYLQLVFLASRKRKNTKKIHKLSEKSSKAKKEKPTEGIPEAAGVGKSSNEELGLEEE